MNTASRSLRANSACQALTSPLPPYSAGRLRPALTMIACAMSSITRWMSQIATSSTSSRLRIGPSCDCPRRPVPIIPTRSRAPGRASAGVNVAVAAANPAAVVDNRKSRRFMAWPRAVDDPRRVAKSGTGDANEHGGRSRRVHSGMARAYFTPCISLLISGATRKKNAPTIKPAQISMVKVWV